MEVSEFRYAIATKPTPLNIYNINESFPYLSTLIITCATPLPALNSKGRTQADGSMHVHNTMCVIFFKFCRMMICSCFTIYICRMSLTVALYVGMILSGLCNYNMYYLLCGHVRE
jgi:hypothetical protein